MKKTQIDCYAPLTDVKINAIKCPGRIEWIKIDYGNTILYQVSYWHNGEQTFAMLHEDEISEL